MFVTRRQLLKAAALTAASPIVAPVLAQRASRVLIVGAGPAGLSAAYELSQAGFDVQVFEASLRTGGRIFTLREPFSDGLYAEAGAQFLVDSNPGIEYARQFELELLPLRFNPDLGTLSYFKGQRVEHRPDQPGTLPFDLKQEEEGKSVAALHAMYRRRPMSQLPELPQLTAADLPLRTFDHLDNKSLLDFWQDLGASEGAIEAMMSLYVRAYADSPEQINLLQLARETASLTGVRGGFMISGGNDRICAALADRLEGRVHLGRSVRAVQQSDSGVALKVEHAAGLDTVSGDLVILTPPPPVLRKINFLPALSEASASALRAAIGVPVTLTYVQTRSRFWLKAGLSGMTQTDLPVAQISDAASLQPGAKGILSSMTYGGQATAMANLTPEARQQLFRSTLNTLYPDSAELDPAGTSYAWGDDPFHRCGHVSFRPGSYVSATNALRQVQGRIFFAGDTVGGVSGYSHAAFASGQEVARAIMAAG